MARRALDETTKPPAARKAGSETYFYAAEVVRILDLQGIDYAQLRRLLRLVRPPGSQPPTRQWARFGFEDLVALRVAVRLAGGTEALATGRRLQLAELERACERLRRLGVKQPLVEIPLRREGRAILADVDSVTFRPSTGQLALPDITARVRAFLGTVHDLERPALAKHRAQIEAERSQLARTAKARRTADARNGGLQA